MATYKSFSGKVTEIENKQVSFEPDIASYQLFTIETESNSIVNLVVSQTSYFIDDSIVVIGDDVTGFYDVNAPVPLIYPPQYSALVVHKEIPEQFVTFAHFDNQLVSDDRTLQLNIDKSTVLSLPDGQPFKGKPSDSDLIVVYSAATRSIPAQTTPSQIIVYR